MVLFPVIFRAFSDFYGSALYFSIDITTRLKEIRFTTFSTYRNVLYGLPDKETHRAELACPHTSAPA